MELNNDDHDDDIDDQYFDNVREEEEIDRKRKQRLSQTTKTIIDYHRREDNSSATTRPRKRSCKKVPIIYVDEDGSVKHLTPKMTFWYSAYVRGGSTRNIRQLKIFRRRFRIPYGEFQELLKELETAEMFRQWRPNNTNASRDDVSPLALLLLGALRYLGRGWTFDDIEEATAIGKETHRIFFHRFIDYGSKVLFDRYVIFPTTAAEARTHMHEYNIAGFPGTPCSTDATHISMDKCPNLLRHVNKGPKKDLPSRTYNLSCNHRKRILYTTSGHPSRWNDKTLQRFDKFMMGIRKGTIMDDVIFELYDKDDDGLVIKVKYNGVWQIVDNGYLLWSSCVPPLKHYDYISEQRWSYWVESIRKDVECTFGILKNRWRILKSPIFIQNVDEVDKIWKTCCALHN